MSLTKELFDFVDSGKKLDNECLNFLENFKKMPKEKWIHRDIYQELKDNQCYDENVQKNKYLGASVEVVKNQTHEEA